MNLKLDKNQEKVVAAACQVAFCEWSNGNEYSQKMAKIAHDLAVQIFIHTMSNKGDTP